MMWKIIAKKITAAVSGDYLGVKSDISRSVLCIDCI